MKYLLILFIILLGDKSYSSLMKSDSSTLGYSNLTDYMEQNFVNKYGKEKTDEIQYEELLFSPSGRFLAFSISQITSGDPEQVWILDLVTKKSRLVTDLVIEGKIGISLDKMKWKTDSLLIIYLARINWKNQWVNKNLVLLASIDITIILNEKEPKNINNCSHEKSKYFKLSYTKDKSKIELTNLRNGKKYYSENGDSYLEDFPCDDYWTNDGKDFVFLANYGHGSIALFVGITSPSFKIIKLIDGNWELMGFAISPYSPKIAYPVFWSSSIDIYDVSKQKNIKKIKTGAFPNRIAWSNNKLIAFVSKRIGTKKSKLLDPNVLYLFTIK